MIIRKLHIENFGKLSDFTLELNEGLNEIFKENGFGKTTLLIFLKAMLYGMPPARENVKMDRKKYSPWKGGNFGGYIEFDCQKGYYRVTRFFGRTPEGDSIEILNLNTNTIVQPLKSEIGEELFDIGRETFEMTAFFSQNNFISFANNQISANILGLDKLKYDLANVNLAVDKIKKKESEVRKLKVNKVEKIKKEEKLLDLKNQLTQLQETFEKTQKEYDDMKKEISNKQARFIELEKEFELQDELLKTKSLIEKELLSLSNQLNSLYLEQQKINESRQNLINNKPKNFKKQKSFTLLVGSALLLLPILLAVFSIITPFISALMAVALAVITIIIYLFFHRKSGDLKAYNAYLNDLNNNYQILNSKIDVLRNNIYNSELTLNNYKNLSQDKTGYYEFKEQINALNMESERKLFFKENLAQEIDSVIENIEILKDEISLIELNEKNIEGKLLILQKTKEFLTQANQNVSMRFVEPVNKSMREILNKFNLGDRSFIVDTNFELKQSTDNGIKEIDYSSQGIKDILYFCLRVFFIKEIYKKEKPIILLDDTFVNLDNVNSKKANEILKILSNDYQVIYCYCKAT